MKSIGMQISPLWDKQNNVPEISVGCTEAISDEVTIADYNPPVTSLAFTSTGITYAAFQVPQRYQINAIVLK